MSHAAGGGGVRVTASGGEGQECTPTRRTSGHTPSDLCQECKRPFSSEGMEVLEAMGHMWHIDCFRCVVCHDSLPETYYESAGLAYCRDHFYEQTAHKCLSCRDYITGPTMTVGMLRMFHPECFVCSRCGILLGEKDPYTLLSTGRLLCRLCERVPSNGEKENATTTFEPGRGALKEPESGGLFGEQRPRSSSAVGGGTTVQLIRIPLTNRKPVKFRLEGEVPSAAAIQEQKTVGGVPGFDTPKLPRPGEEVIRKNALRIEKLPRSLAGSALTMGDEILEINGVPIVDQDQQEINALMHAYEDCLYLTIERKRAASPSADTVVPPSSSSSSHHHPHSSNQSLTSTPSHPSPPSPPSPTNQNGSSDAVAAPPTSLVGGGGGRPYVKKKPVPLPRSRPPPILRKAALSSSKIAAKRPMSTCSPSPKSPRSWRTRSIPALDGKADYTECFRLNDLELGEVIGRGFYGSVCKVTHKFTSQVMVMKEMRNCTEESKKSFLKEVQMLKCVNHPNILQFIGILHREGRVLVLITEYADGGTLRKTIKNFGKPFPWATRIGIARDIASGMSYLHHQDIIHRDLTSKNVLLRKVHIMFIHVALCV